MTIDTAFEGIEDATYDHCYISMNEKESQARIDIQPAAVTKLKLLNRADISCGNLTLIGFRGLAEEEPQKVDNLLVKVIVETCWTKPKLNYKY